MTNSPLPLAAGFSEVSLDAWRKSLDKVLKGASFEKKMIVKTYDGIDIQPLYTKADWDGSSNPSGLPGQAPFMRGNSAEGSSIGGWDIRQVHANPDVIKANKQILDDLERGVTSLTLKFDACAEKGMDALAPEAKNLIGQNGLMVYSIEQLEDLLDGVMLDLVAVSLDAGEQAASAAALLAGLWERRGHKPEEVSGAFNLDPLGSLAKSGHLSQSVQQALHSLGELAKETSDTYPNVTAAKVDTSVYYGGGASETQDLAYALATGVTYLRAMVEAGLSVDEAAQQIVFCFSNGAEIFPAIAKLRAARFLWTQVIKASGGSDEACAMKLHIGTSERALSKRDPWVNMLRTTATCFAGAIGGADSITVLPFDHHCGVADDFARRIARNTQIVLQEESSLNKVVDPAGGSWFIESLSNEYVKKAWSLFQEIEAKGGMAECLKSGFVQGEIAKTWDARLKNIAKRKDPLTGISEFPNILEDTVEREIADTQALLAKIKPALTAATAVEVPGTSLGSLVMAAKNGASIQLLAANLKGEGTSVKAVPAHRLGEEFEALRDKADAYKVAHGTFPQIFSANIGAIAKHTARATFAKNFFEAGGVQASTNKGFATVEEAVQGFKDSKAEVAVICGSDAQYEDRAADFAKALKAAGAKTVYLAGRGEFEGVDETITMGSDLLEILKKLHSVLGV